MQQSLPIWDYNIFRKSEHFAITITAPREQGKSTLFRDIFIKCNMRDLFDIHVLFSKTCDMNFFGEFFPGDGRLFYRGFDPARLRKILDNADKFYAIHGRYLDILVVFDDCVGSSTNDKDPKNIKNENDILELFTLGRHKGISVIFLTQSPTLINKNWRTNTNISIMLYSPDENDKDHMYNNALAGVDMRKAKWSDGSDIVVPAQYKSQTHTGPPKRKFMLDLYEMTCHDYWAIVVNTKPSAVQSIAKYKAGVEHQAKNNEVSPRVRENPPIKSCLKQVTINERANQTRMI